MIKDIECPSCDGEGKATGSVPSRRSRFVDHDNLDPDDYAIECERCGGTGVIEYDLEDDAE